MLIHIDDPTDPRIEPYMAVRERDLVVRDDRFVAEGKVVLRVLVNRSRFAIESVLIAENRSAGLSPILAQIPHGIPVYCASRHVMDAIVGFPIHRGILAIGRRGPPVDPVTLLSALPERALVVAMVGLANHDNVGGIFRNAAAFGASAVLIDAATCDPLYRKAIRVSVGCSLVVPFARFDSAGALCSALDAACFETLALTPAGAEPLAAIGSAARMALLVGAEGAGLPAPVLARCRTVRIPMAQGFDSLNVATAAGIALHHLVESNAT